MFQKIIIKWGDIEAFTTKSSSYLAGGGGFSDRYFLILFTKNPKRKLKIFLGIDIRPEILDVILKFLDYMILDASKNDL